MVIETFILAGAAVSITMIVTSHLRRTSLPALPEDPARVAIVEKRRIIERDREEWLAGCEPIVDAERNLREIARCDAELIKLADEERDL